MIFSHSALLYLSRAQQDRPDHCRCSHMQCLQIAAPRRSALQSACPDSSKKHDALPPPKIEKVALK